MLVPFLRSSPWSPDGVRASGADCESQVRTQSWLHAAAENEPERLQPGVMVRPGSDKADG